MRCNIADLNPAPAAEFLVSIGGSAGALDPLSSLLARLPNDWRPAVIVALHTGRGSELPAVLRLRSPLPVDWACEGEYLRSGRVYVARPGTHIIVNPDGRVSLSEARRVRLFRPSVDWLFESAAASFGYRHVAVVLSGLLSDGSVALRASKRSGSHVFVQDPATCGYPDMPRAAIATGYADAIMRVEDMPAALSAVLGGRVQPVVAASSQPSQS